MLVENYIELDKITFMMNTKSLSYNSLNPSLDVTNISIDPNIYKRRSVVLTPRGISLQTNFKQVISRYPIFRFSEI